MGKIITATPEGVKKLDFEIGITLDRCGIRRDLITLSRPEVPHNAWDALLENIRRDGRLTCPSKFQTPGRDTTSETVVFSTGVSLAKHLGVTDNIVSGMYGRVVKFGQKDYWCVFGSVCVDSHSTFYP